VVSGLEGDFWESKVKIERVCMWEISRVIVDPHDYSNLIPKLLL